jgi:cytochrome b561
MSYRNSDSAWGGVAKALHWGVALLIAVQLVLGFLRHWKAIGNAAWESVYAWVHLPVGFMVLGLAGLRLAWRFAQPHPQLPPQTTWWERLGANGTHTYFYVAMVVMPMTGWIGFNAIKLEVAPFGVTLPHLIWDARPLGFAAASVHLWVAYGLVGALLLHAGAAAVHHWVKRDDVLLRMLPAGLHGRFAR